MKRCKCEHWQTCPTCYPQGFDEHGARKPVEIHSSREELQREITALREQVEKWKSLHESLTKLNEAQERRHEKQVEKLRVERDGYGRRNGRLRSELAELDAKLAALAAQNEKMRAFVTKISEQTPEKPDYWSSCGQCEHNSSNAEDLLELPDLATPVLNKYRAEGMRMAAEIVGPEDSYQDDWFKAKADSCAKLRAKADELEKINAAPFA